MKIYASKEMKRFNHLISETEALYHEISLKLGLSDSALSILYTICNNGESCPLNEICHISGISKQTINSSLRKLEADDIVYLEQIGGKSKNVCLTEKGKYLAKGTAVRVIEAENEILASWGQEDVEKYLELLEHFLRDLTEKMKEIVP